MFLDDVRPGARFDAARTTVTEDAIVRFGREFDPQPMHTDPSSPEAARFGGVIASGFHTVAMAMRAMVEAGILCDDGAIGYGADEIRFLRPVRPGDDLALTIEILDVEQNPRNSRGRVAAGVAFGPSPDDLVLTMRIIVGLRPRTRAHA